MRHCLAVCREFGKSYVLAVNANQLASVQEINRADRRPTVSTGCQESALGSSIPLIVQAFCVYCKSYDRRNYLIS